MAPPPPPRPRPLLAPRRDIPSHLKPILLSLIDDHLLPTDSTHHLPLLLASLQSFPADHPLRDHLLVTVVSAFASALAPPISSSSSSPLAALVDALLDTANRPNHAPDPRPRLRRPARARRRAPRPPRPCPRPPLRARRRRALPSSAVLSPPARLRRPSLRSPRKAGIHRLHPGGLRPAHALLRARAPPVTTASPLKPLLRPPRRATSGT
ncbi:hypothetical protein PR202_ga03472 [Eleusine coracana subsp. coracana]|uniref:Uncharacterized protein n=1 Tax=Eleusine coracana subsp. coracana TaxID=191504 RepID=A0AAV5BMH5_ELECO|nr:hypothetical protein PR202_ga03472 [Eleusine coracana subsp. coracana]